MCWLFVLALHFTKAGQIICSALFLHFDLFRIQEASILIPLSPIIMVNMVTILTWLAAQMQSMWSLVKRLSIARKFRIIWLCFTSYRKKMNKQSQLKSHTEKSKTNKNVIKIRIWSSETVSCNSAGNSKKNKQTNWDIVEWYLRMR